MSNEIKLMKGENHFVDSNGSPWSDIDIVNEFYMFLRGEQPDSVRVTRGHAPKLSHKQAWTVIWYLQEHLPVFPDHIEKCSVCLEFFDSWAEGDYNERTGKNYCGGCR